MPWRARPTRRPRDPRPARLATTVVNLAALIAALWGLIRAALYLLKYYNTAAAAVFVVAFVLVGVDAAAIYMYPTLVALARNRDRVWGLAAVNLLLGWTIILWLVALVWAYTGTAERSN